VAAYRVNLGNYRNVSACARNFNGCPESGESSADNQNIMLIHRLASALVYKCLQILSP
jgi:hypothetical protein